MAFQRRGVSFGGPAGTPLRVSVLGPRRVLDKFLGFASFSSGVLARLYPSSPFFFFSWFHLIGIGDDLIFLPNFPDGLTIVGPVAFPACS